jgi:threonine/homoserine/homoserine lactone efflux protein
MSLEFYLAYVAACIVIVIVPGPTVTLIVANSLRHGTAAGLLNVAGTQLGIGVMMMIVAVGLASLMATMSIWFDWVRLAGAAYLIWLGVRMFRASGSLQGADKAVRPRGGFFLQGFLVLMSNPKVLLLFGAFIPQFVDPKGDYVGQVILLGVTAMVTAAIFDSIYAVLAGRAGQMLSRSRVRLLSRISGVFLIGGGLWMALARTR